MLSLTEARRGRLRTLAALPFYWAMHWVAAWRALHQLVRAPFVWEKTPHGVDAVITARPERTLAGLRGSVAA